MLGLLPIYLDTTIVNNPKSYLEFLERRPDGVGSEATANIIISSKCRDINDSLPKYSNQASTMHAFTFDDCQLNPQPDLAAFQISDANTRNTGSELDIDHYFLDLKILQLLSKNKAILDSRWDDAKEITQFDVADLMEKAVAAVGADIDDFSVLEQVVDH